LKKPIDILLKSYYAFSEIRLNKGRKWPMGKGGHRIQLVIKGQDASCEDSPESFHLPNMKETPHTIYHNSEYPSYLLIPIILKWVTGVGMSVYG